MPTKQCEILVIDDDPAEAYVIQLAWKKCNLVTSNVPILNETVDATAYLRGATKHHNTVVPDLIMLDYKMPIDGGIALTEIKGDPDYLQIPIVVLTGSSNPKDYMDAYRRHANCVYRKPSELKEYEDLICHIANSWLIRAVLPPVPKNEAS